MASAERVNELATKYTLLELASIVADQEQHIANQEKQIDHLQENLCLYRKTVNQAVQTLHEANEKKHAEIRTQKFIEGLKVIE